MNRKDKARLKKEAERKAEADRLAAIEAERIAAEKAEEERKKLEGEI
jgi:hypothetical protein